MATVNLFGELANDDSVTLLRRIVQLLEPMGNRDVGNRQRVTIDALTAGMTLSVVGTVSNIGTISSLDHRQFHDMARTAYNTGPRARIEKV